MNADQTSEHELRDSLRAIAKGMKRGESRTGDVSTEVLNSRVLTVRL